MEDVEDFLAGESSRRDLLVATTGLAALTGCTGDQGSENKSGNTSAIDGANDNKGADQDKIGNKDNGEYPVQDSSSIGEKVYNRMAKNREGAFGIKIDDYQFLNVDGSPGELSDNPTFEKALSEATEMDVGGPSDTIYIFQHRSDVEEENSAGRIEFVVNIENIGESQLEDGKNYLVGVSPNLDYSPLVQNSPSEVEDAYEDFFRKYIDDEGIVHHAGEIPEYAKDGLENGWQA